MADRTIEAGLLNYCQANGLTVIAYSPLGHTFQSILDCDPAGALADIARMTGRTMAQVAINWCLCTDGVVAIPKGSSTAHVVENCGASGWRLTADQRRLLDRSIRWRRRGPMETLVRGVLPPPLKRAVRDIVQMLPQSLRRRFS